MIDRDPTLRGLFYVKKRYFMLKNNKKRLKMY
jgi:hypothetical protein